MPRASASTTEKTIRTTRKTRAKTPAQKTTATRATKTTRTRRVRRQSTAATERPASTRRRDREDVQDETPVVDSAPGSSNEPERKAASRKAPTRFASEARRLKDKRVQLGVVAALLVIGIGASAVVGFSDQGQIDVELTIQEREQRMANLVDVDGPVTTGPAPEESESTESVQRLNPALMQGIKPGSSNPPPRATPATTTATSSATSTATTSPGTNGVNDDDTVTTSATTTVTATTSQTDETTESGGDQAASEI